MKTTYLLLIFVLLTTACDSTTSEQASQIIGKWKIYRTTMSGKDISKSADPKNENGLEFKKNGSYLSFGTPRHRDNGTYSLSNGGKTLLMTSEKIEGGSTTASMDLQGDSLRLGIQMDEKQKLELALFRMK